ncbi:enhancer of polycomb homolog 1 [Bacillus rossius redtenbacheri]|uniref:enhancer of polycomb homolog 1 n=1 Tax=Bacillus rossius redtenbacheri TaxID=93214 RepID=UPI002FDC9B6E
MSKLSFRPRALDASKPMPIYMAEELPDLPDYSAINRAVPQIPSGMEKEEECEHHLQRAIVTGLIIPTPEVSEIPDEIYNRLYPQDYKMPRQFIHMQPFAMEQDIPDYDMDSEDESWVNAQAKKFDLTPRKFEEMMDRLEKGSGQTVLKLQEAKALLKEDDDLIRAVYDYWLDKRLKTQHPLIPTVKTEHRIGLAINSPYLAFRRRTEKMQTRKVRKNDETSYEKMLKLKRDLGRAVTLLELVKRREKTKRELLHLSIEIFEKRYQAGDFSGQLLAELSALKAPRPAFAPIFTNQNWVNKVSSKDEVVPRKRSYKKRKHKSNAGVGRSCAGSDLLGGDLVSTDEEPDPLLGSAPAPEEEEAADPADGPFGFRRNKFCNYHAPLPNGLGNWPWAGREEGGLPDTRYRYCLTSLSVPQKRCIGFARRRVGRGGRVILDRASTSIDDILASHGYSVLDSASSTPNSVLPPETRDWLHFRPRTPSTPGSSEKEDVEADMFNTSREVQALDDVTLSVGLEPLAANVFNLSDGSLSSQLCLNLLPPVPEAGVAPETRQLCRSEWSSYDQEDGELWTDDVFTIGCSRFTVRQSSATCESIFPFAPFSSEISLSVMETRTSATVVQHSDGHASASQLRLQQPSISSPTTSNSRAGSHPVPQTSTANSGFPPSLSTAFENNSVSLAPSASSSVRFPLTASCSVAAAVASTVNVSTFNNGGVVVKQEPINTEYNDVRDTSLVGATSIDQHTLSNGPLSAGEHPNSSWTRPGSNYLSPYHSTSPLQGAGAPSTLPPPASTLSMGFHHRTPASSPHRQYTLVDVANIKKEPNPTEDTLNSGGMSVAGNNSEKVSSDDKQLVRKNSSVPMEVT